MTVRELMDILSGFPESMKVAINCDHSEDQDMASIAEIIGIDEAPYAKGDNIWAFNALPKDEKVVFIH